MASMSFKQGIPREQNIMTSPESYIGDDSPVRVIDMFVEMLDLSELGFTKISFRKEGRPPFEAKALLKLYYYGYINRIRSSRKLEAECLRNIELWWLVYHLTPGYHTIADFRKDNAAALKKAFKEFTAFLKGEDLLGGEVVGVDGTKIRAQNNKKNNFNEGKFAKSFEYIEGQEEKYLRELDEFDAQENRQASALKKKDIIEKLEELKERKQNYTQLRETMNESGEKQISLSDPESRSLPLNDVVTAVCFNVQAVSDNKHSLIVEFDTINTSDQGQLCPMVTKAMEVLGVKEITVLADKGYHTGKDLYDCKEALITTVTAYPDKDNKNIDPAYRKSAFAYDKEHDIYTCPQGAILTTNGNAYDKVKKGRSTYSVKKYVTDQCLICIARFQCTKAKSREIERSEYQDVVDENNKRMDENLPLYKTRQQISEHPFGTIKRSWGYTYTLLRGIKKVNGEMAIIFTVYNIRRAMSIISVKGLIKRLNDLKEAKLVILRTFEQYRNRGSVMAA